MAKFLGNVVVLEETSLPALFYYKYLCESHDKEVKYAPVQYYDEIDKKGIDSSFETMMEWNRMNNHILPEALDNTLNVISEVTKTVWHGFKAINVHENVKDEGLAKKQAQVIQKMIKNHEAPYDNIFKKYSVTVLQG